jgi:hypothetical protein
VIEPVLEGAPVLGATGLPLCATERAARLAKHEASDSPVFIAQRVRDLEARSTIVARTASTSGTSTERPGAAMSSLPMMVTCAEELVGDARVMTQPRSVTTSKPRSTKKSRVAAGRSDLMFGTILLIAMSQFYRTAMSPPSIRP